MDRVDNNAQLWAPAQVCLRGAYSAGTSDVPRVGDPKPLLKFLRYHIKERARFASQHIYHVFCALVVAHDEDTDRGLAAYDFTDPPFIDTMIAALEDKDFTFFRQSAIFLLANLDSNLFITDKAFRDAKRAFRFVHAWSSAVHEFLADPSPTHLQETTVVKVLLAIANLPCLRKHLPRERWTLIEHFPFVMLENPPPLQRCLRDPTIIPFLEPIAGTKTPIPWLEMFWVMYHNLSPEVRTQLEEQSKKIAAGAHPYRLQACASRLDAYIKNLDNQISKLDKVDQAASNLQAKRRLTVQTKDRLRSIQNQGR
jgi:hypothetical protein